MASLPNTKPSWLNKYEAKLQFEASMEDPALDHRNPKSKLAAEAFLKEYIYTITSTTPSARD